MHGKEECPDDDLEMQDYVKFSTSLLRISCV